MQKKFKIRYVLQNFHKHLDIIFKLMKNLVQYIPAIICCVISHFHFWEPIIMMYIYHANIQATYSKNNTGKKLLVCSTQQLSLFQSLL